GEVEGGGGVGRAAATRDSAVDIAGPPLVGALEQHVLLEVRVAELVRTLVADAHADVHVDGDDVRCAVILNDQPQAVGQHLANRRRQLAARRRARGHAARSAGAGAHQKRRAEERQDDGALPDAGSTHCTFPVSSSTLPARSTVTLYALPAGFPARVSRIFATLAASAFIPSTVSRMSPPSGT